MNWSSSLDICTRRKRLFGQLYMHTSQLFVPRKQGHFFKFHMFATERKINIYNEYLARSDQWISWFEVSFTWLEPSFNMAFWKQLSEISSFKKGPQNYSFFLIPNRSVKPHVSVYIGLCRTAFERRNCGTIIVQILHFLVNFIEFVLWSAIRKGI